MIDGLISGSLAKDVESRTAKNGNTYALASLRVPAGDGVLLARVMAFDALVRDELLALAKGDSVSVTGPLELGIWNTDNGESRVSVSMIAHALVSAYHVKRKRAQIGNARTVATGRKSAHGKGLRASASRSSSRSSDSFHDDSLNDL
ncbi:single-stranded DNA-binding protein [Paraburkholderia sp. J11-2]|uniref:single-stranded DNA-binding protein n=1 Tax=Paraburkholderia sp. J11-2 TaxID=2805431 RepID=UPI002AB68A38|nr:single-stranded DNA-binding protein [Paraburkholderia sp. J11-2]